jgi:hypothetical protein
MLTLLYDDFGSGNPLHSANELVLWVTEMENHFVYIAIGIANNSRVNLVTMPGMSAFPWRLTGVLARYCSNAFVATTVSMAKNGDFNRHLLI